MRYAFIALPLLTIAAMPVWADDGGVISFAGTIREPTRVVGGGLLPAGGSGRGATTRQLSAGTLAGVPLFAYARDRDSTVRWQVVEVTFR
ncbi:MAG TPA: hypothetical protein VGN46_16235 [Luteibacter sp.]|jgi:hypothetical protein|uniref:hypothetical protein n=1 Tax=Luteibacter sp. TaxID=1886636 RepID=UPI002F407041